MGDMAREPAESKQEEIQQGDGRKASDSADSATSGICQEDDEKGTQQSVTVFVFWASVAAFVAAITLFMLFISSIMPPDEETEFLSMPPAVRQHYTSGKLLKIDIGNDRVPLKVFVRDEGTLKSSATVLLCHGLGTSSFAYRSLISSFASRGFRIIALDFPGAGLSEKPFAEKGGLFLKAREIINEVMEKGLLWRFEQMFETGSFPEPTPTRVELGVQYDAGDLSESISEVLSLLASSPVHIVLHDTSIEAGLVWATQNPTSVLSITLLDTYPGTPSFPVGLLGIPGLGFLILRSSLLLQSVLRLCCVTHVSQVEIKSYAFLLRNHGGHRAVLKTWEMANTTFDMISSIEKLGDLPVHLVWSNSSGKRWQELGEWLVSRLPRASCSSHSGGRWPQEDKASEVTELLYSFIISLPSTVHSSVVEDMQEDAYELSAANDHHTINNQAHFHSHHQEYDNDHGHLHDDSNLHHTHDEGLGYMEPMDYGGWML